MKYHCFLSEQKKSRSESCCILGNIILCLVLRWAAMLGHRLNDLGQKYGRPYVVYYRVLQAYLIPITELFFFSAEGKGSIG